MRSSMATRVAFLIYVVLVAGCGSQTTSPVEGVVLMDGKPVVGASIQFVPQGKGRDATGETDKSGQFVMSTYQPRDGVLPGSYKVVISPPTGTADTARYASAEEAMAATSKQAAKKDATGSFPQKYARADQTPLLQEVPVKGKVKFELQK